MFDTLAATMFVTGDWLLVLGVVFGFAFGFLLQRGGVTNYNVIVNQFLFRDFTVLKIMLTAIVVGAAGVLAMYAGDIAKLHIKEANMLSVIVGAAIFGVGMVVLGYCPGTGIAAAASGSMHALVGLVGMIAGAILYALSFTWVNKHIASVWQLGKARLSTVTALPDWAWWLLLAVMSAAVFMLLHRYEKRRQVV